MSGSMVGVVCKGSMALGSGCGYCERCASEVVEEALRAPKPPPKPPHLMDHRDVIDAAREHVAGGGNVKFMLPVGAFLGGLYHLGNGVFVGKLPAPSDFRRPPRLIAPHESWSLAGTQALLEAQPRFIALELCDDPLPSSLAAGEYRRVVPTHVTVKMVEAATGDQVWRSVQTGKVIKRRGPKR